MTPMMDRAPAARRRRRNRNFDFPAIRRKEIVRHARLVGAAETEDFCRWLIAWVWHNRNAKDQIWPVMEAAKRMGGKLTEAEASAITKLLALGLVETDWPERRQPLRVAGRS
jgi:hypothetical protein